MNEFINTTLRLSNVRRDRRWNKLDHRSDSRNYKVVPSNHDLKRKDYYRCDAGARIERKKLLVELVPTNAFSIHAHTRTYEDLGV